MRHGGFSLVELSIVLVIIGLLIGGVLVGKNLVRTAQLRSVATDVDKFGSAINAFRAKYGQLPGDFNEATSYWGAAHATPATCKTTASTGKETCNGDANGRIITNTDQTTWYEAFRAWQHLKNEGLIEGNYTGIATDAGYEVTPGTNVPASKITGAGYHIFSIGYYVGDVNWFASTYNHLIMFGAKLSATFNYNPVISPEDAYSIDLKIDDGKPASGDVLAFKSTSTLTPNCTTTAVASTSAYNVTNTAILCNLIFKMGF